MKIVRFRSFSLAAWLAAGLLSTTVSGFAAVPAIVDGGFENPAEAANSLTEVSTGAPGAPTVPGWTGNYIGGSAHEYLINGNVQDLQGRNYGITPYGQQYLGLNAIANRSFRSIESQSLTGFTAGQTYELTVYIANLDGASDPNMSIVASDGTDGSGTVLAQETVSAGAGNGPYGQGNIYFVPETLDFTATSDGVTFSIGNQSKTGTMGLDNVSLAAVPEPTTVATVLLGLVALAGVMLRRRARLA